MYQTFSTPVDAGHTAERVIQLRRAMASRQLDALVVPRADQYQGEYVPPSAERLRWLTGFTGSAGVAVITSDRAALFVDGRYTVQVRTETDLQVFEIQQAPEQTVIDWLSRMLSAGAVVGFDPWLQTLAWSETMTTSLNGKAMRLTPVDGNLVDEVWGAVRPAEPTAPVMVQPIAYAGTAASTKLAALRQQLETAGQRATVLTLPDSICWLFNIRGSDIAHNPVALAFAVVPAAGPAELFIDPAKLSDETRAYLSPIAELRPITVFADRLRALGAEATIVATGAATAPGVVPLAAVGAVKPVRIDPDTAAFAVARALGIDNIARGRDPCIDPKAKKCAAEIAGARAAHLRDGLAVTRFLAWLDMALVAGEQLDEITAVRQLEVFRARSPMLRDISFPTISGSGPNGAIVHYRVTEATNRPFGDGELLLIDSGGQYVDGTTDITRTVMISRGEDAPGVTMRERYTAVLKGHIAISTARFPAGTRGVDLDAMARRPLWEMGLDYDHGTGHGVGSYLSVHEGPAGISKRATIALEAGMILSNEPGYYAGGAYGIRIENLVLIQPGVVPPGGERSMLGFETLTLAPYDRRLIVTDALTPAERKWVDRYHARVMADIGPLLAAAEDAATVQWLRSATAPLT